MREGPELRRRRVDRRESLGRRIARDRRHDDVPVEHERRRGAERRSGMARRSGEERRPNIDERFSQTG